MRKLKQREKNRIKKALSTKDGRNKYAEIFRKCIYTELHYQRDHDGSFINEDGNWENINRIDNFLDIIEEEIKTMLSLASPRKN